MKFNKLVAVCLIFGVAVNCTSSERTDGSSKPTSNPTPAANPPGTSPSAGVTGLSSTAEAHAASVVSGPSVTGTNVMQVTVNGSLCGPVESQYVNQPCTSVTICPAGSTSGCQTINNILLDTGSFGLRIFSSAINISLTQKNDTSGNPVAECAHFGSGTDWGPVKMANVILGGEPAVQVPIHVIDSTFAKYPASCGTPDTSPEDAGFNGILGVGLFADDCGSGCASDANNGMYYSCVGNSCTGIKMPVAQQVTNPVALLPEDNNGVVLVLPSVPTGGVGTVNGTLFLGIGTQDNNTPTGVTKIPANSSGEMSTTYAGNTTSAILDSGSNGIFFDNSGQPFCASPAPDWFCPTSLQTLSATHKGSGGSPNLAVSFKIGNFLNYWNTTTNAVFSDVGARSGHSMFIWGLPFHFGRSVYVGIENTTSTIGTGPYWAY